MKVTIFQSLHAAPEPPSEFARDLRRNLLKLLSQAGATHMGGVDVEDDKLLSVAYTVIRMPDGSLKLFAENTDNVYGYANNDDVARLYPDAASAWKENFESEFPPLEGWMPFWTSYLMDIRDGKMKEPWVAH